MFCLFAEVIMERLKVRWEAQGAKQEAEIGSAKMAVDGLTLQADSVEQKDTQSKEDGSSQSKSQLNIQNILF